MFENETTSKQIEALSNLNVSSLERVELKALDFDFENIAKKVKAMIASLSLIEKEGSGINISTKTEDYLRAVAENIQDSIIPSILNFTVRDNPNSSTEYTSILTNVNNVQSTFLDQVQPLLTEIKVNSLASNEASDEISSIKKIKKESEEILSSLKEEKKAAEKIVKTARDASGIKASEISGSIFLTQSKEHADLAFWWLSAAGAFFLILFVVFVLEFNGIWPFESFAIEKINGDKLSLIHAIIFKLLILSSLYFLLHQAIKNYKINKHLYVINKHKHNALAVYPTILTAGEDSESRASIAMQASKSIFEQIPTGYLNGDDDPRPINPTSVIAKFIDKK